MSNSNGERVKPIVVAAGFGERMENPDLPKGLINVDGQNTIMGLMLSDLMTIPGLDPTALITNARFSATYRRWIREWQRANKIPGEIKVINNRIKSPDKRRGAIGDLMYALDHLGWSDTNLFAMMSDTLYRGSLADFLNFASHTVSASGLVTMVYETEPEKIKNRLGSVQMDGHRIEKFVEKPDVPLSPLAIAPFYFYPKGLLHMLRSYKNQGGNLDAPSSIIDWFLQKKVPVFGYRAPPSLDVGTIKDIAAAQLYVSA